MFSFLSHRSKSHVSGRPGGLDDVVIRIASPADDAEIDQIAALDEKSFPMGTKLVAEVDSEVVAAISVDDRHVVANPFRWTADAVALLEMRAAQLEGIELAPASSGGGTAVKPLRTQLT